MPVISFRNSTDDGWIQVSGYISEHSMAWFISGNLEVGIHPLTINNLFEYDLVITKMKAYVKTSPVGSPIAIDVLIDGTSILSEYYYIPDGGQGSLLEMPSGFGTLLSGHILTIEIISVGSSTPGADMTFQIGGKVV